MNKRGNIIFGLIFVVLGALFLLKNLQIYDFSLRILDISFIISRFWALIFVALPGFAMHSVYFSGKNKDAGILVPGGILLVSGLVCQFSTSFNAWHLLWPGFILAVAVGLFELYLFGGRERGLLIPVVILGTISLMFFTSFSFKTLLGVNLRQLIIPVVLVVLGLMIIFGRKPGNRDF